MRVSPFSCIFPLCFFFSLFLHLQTHYRGFYPKAFPRLFWSLTHDTYVGDSRALNFITVIYLEIVCLSWKTCQLTGDLRRQGSSQFFIDHKVWSSLCEYQPLVIIGDAETIISILMKLWAPVTRIMVVFLSSVSSLRITEEASSPLLFRSSWFIIFSNSHPDCP